MSDVVVEKKEEKSYVTKGEYWSFGLAGFGQNMIYMMVATYLMVFYTEVALLPTAAVTLMFTVARIWDAINDPIMGMFVDRVNPAKSKLGKFRPFLISIPIPIAILTVMLFWMPEVNRSLQIVYMYCTYILWGMLYTVGDVPLWGMSSAITPNNKERTQFISFSRIFCTIGSVVPLLLMAIIPAIVPGDTVSDKKVQFFIGGIFCAVIGGAMFLLAGLKNKERVSIPPQRTKYLDNFKMLKDNKPLLLVLLAGIIGSARVMAQVGATYVAQYCFYGPINFLGMQITDMSQKLLFINIGFGAGMFLGTVLAPWLQKKFNFKKLYLWSSLIGGVLQLATFACGFSNLYVVIIMMTLSSVSLGIYNVLTYNMIADSIDYLEWKTGERKEGMCFSFQTFMTKFAAGMATLFAGIVMMIVGFKEAVVVGDIIQPATQTENWGFYAMVSIIPAIGCFLACIPILWYDYIGKKRDDIIKELAQQREERGLSYDNGLDQHKKDEAKA